MTDEKRRELYREAFALLDRVNYLLATALKRHEARAANR